MENITIVLFPTKPGKNGDCLENDRKKIKNNLSINNPPKKGRQTTSIAKIANPIHLKNMMN